MARRVQIAVFLISVFEIVEATHLRGATISWKPTPPSMVTVTWRTSWDLGLGPCGSLCSNESINTLGRNSQGDLRVDYGCDAVEHIPHTYYVTEVSIADHTEQGIGSTTAAFCGPYKYDVEFQKCCAWPVLAGKKHSDSSSLFNLATVLNIGTRSDTGLVNSSPIAASKGLYSVIFGCTFRLRIPVFDPDGDRMVCRWARKNGFLGKDECGGVCDNLFHATLTGDCVLEFNANPVNNYVVSSYYAVTMVVEDFAEDTIKVGGITTIPQTPLSSIPLQFLVKTIPGSCLHKPTLWFGNPSNPRLGKRSAGPNEWRYTPNPWNINPSYKEVVTIAPGTNFTRILCAQARSELVPITEFILVAPVGMTRGQLYSPEVAITCMEVVWSPTAAQAGGHLFCYDAADEHSITTDSYCLTLLAWDTSDECSSDPCPPNHVCTNLLNKYSCICPAGYWGPSCQLDRNECRSNPCQNFGRCNDLVNHITCTCAPGYTGVFCAAEIDECVPRPCLNGGTCVDLVSYYRCDCLPGYTGLQCQFDTDECIPRPCENGATCNNLVNHYNCKCRPGYTGFHCDHDIDECRSSPCYNNATCIDGVDGYSCSCVPGYSGVRCETDLDECASNPCSLNGTCHDRVDRYECVCVLGYGGVHCETVVGHLGGDCSDCPHGHRTCTNIVEYSRCHEGLCQCLPGFNSTSASQMVCCEINECDSSPCQNGGTCNNLINRYNCSCRDGFISTNCEIPVGILGAKCSSGEFCSNVIANSLCIHGQCDCISNFYRSENYTCEINRVNMNIFLKLDGQLTPELLDRTSTQFKEYENLACAGAANAIDRGNLAQTLDSCTVAEFINGSIIANLRLVFKNYTALADSDSDSVQRAINDNWDSLVTGWTVDPEFHVAVTDFNQCLSPVTNDCSKWATCKDLNGTGHLDRYTCVCLTGYRDMSSAVGKAGFGRSCGQICPEDYCLNHGRCMQPMDGLLSCKCIDNMQGNRCQIDPKIDPNLRPSDRAWMIPFIIALIFAAGFFTLFVVLIWRRGNRKRKNVALLDRSGSPNYSSRLYENAMPGQLGRQNSFIFKPDHMYFPDKCT